MNAVLVYEKPKALFFPLLKNVYSPFAGPVGSPKYYFYRAVNTVGAQAGSFYWGEWKDGKKDADLFVLFDYGYQRGMETLLHKKYPGKKVVLFCWNKIDETHQSYRKFSDPNTIYSTDQNDCREYGLRFQTIFYPTELIHPYGGEKKHILFVGADKGRAALIRQLEKPLQNAGLTSEFLILPDKTSVSSDGANRLSKPLSYKEYLKRTDQADILLDIVQPHQTGLTLRVMEAVFRSKKLITNNPVVKSIEGFPKEDLLFIQDDPRAIDERAVVSFVNEPFVPYPKELIEYYSYEAWLSRFQENE